MCKAGHPDNGAIVQVAFKPGPRIPIMNPTFLSRLRNNKHSSSESPKVVYNHHKVSEQNNTVTIIINIKILN